MERLSDRLVVRMTGGINSSQFWPEDLIEQAIRIIMNRFHVDAAEALKVLRRMSQNTRTQMCVVAEQIINNDVPLEAVRGLEEECTRLRLIPETKRQI